MKSALYGLPRVLAWLCGNTEMLRLMAGVDLRSSPIFGVGFYGGVRFGRYTHFDTGDTVPFVSEHIDDQRVHTTLEAGLRFTLFP